MGGDRRMAWCQDEEAAPIGGAVARAARRRMPPRAGSTAAVARRRMPEGGYDVTYSRKSLVHGLEAVEELQEGAHADAGAALGRVRIFAVAPRWAGDVEVGPRH